MGADQLKVVTKLKISPSKLVVSEHRVCGAVGQQNWLPAPTTGTNITRPGYEVSWDMPEQME